MEMWKSADGGQTWTGPVHIQSLLVLPSGRGVTTAVAPILNLTQPVNAGVNQLVGQVMIPPGVNDVMIVLTDITDEATHTVFFDKIGLFGND
jgi:hypothetical protein